MACTLSFEAGPSRGPAYTFPQRGDPGEAEALRRELGREHAALADLPQLDRLRAICHWVHMRWSHDGGNAAGTSDPLAILAAAKAGARFRCIEFAVLMAAMGTAMGLPTRYVHLMKSSVESEALGAGHAIAEAWISPLGKWVMVDPQWNLIPFRASTPLSAIELGLALTGNREGLSAAVPSSVTLHYFDWIAPYLYYLTVESDSPEPRTLLRLAPLGAPNPTMFQGRRTLPPSTLTHNLEQFYSAPQR